MRNNWKHKSRSNIISPFDQLQATESAAPNVVTISVRNRGLAIPQLALMGISKRGNRLDINIYHREHLLAQEEQKRIGA